MKHATKTPKQTISEIPKPTGSAVFTIRLRPDDWSNELLSGAALRGFAVQELSDPQALRVIHSASPGVFAARLRQSSDFPELLRWLEAITAMQLDTKHQMLIINELNEARIWSHLREVGCTVLSPSLLGGPKQLMARIDQQLHLIELTSKGPALERLLRPTVAASKAIALAPPPRIGWAQPLHLEEDCWIIPPEPWIQQSRGRWALGLLGPSPVGMSWEKCGPPSGYFGGGPVWWRYSVTSGGNWYFRGKKPLHQEGRWIFLASHPELIFSDTDERLHWKLGNTSKNSIECAANSPYALTQVLRQSEPHAADPNKTPALEGVFKNVENAELLRQLLQEGAASGALLLFRIRASGEVARAALNDVDPIELKFSLTMIPEKTDPGFRAKAFAATPKEIYATFPSPKGPIFIVIESLEGDWDSHRLTARPTSAIFQTQRRASPRIPVTTSTQVSAQILKTPVPVLNISSTGACLNLTKQVHSLLEVCKTFPLKLQIQGTDIACDAEIRWLDEPSRGSCAQTRVGVRFLNLSPEDSSFLQIVCFDLQIHEESK